MVAALFFLRVELCLNARHVADAEARSEDCDFHFLVERGVGGKTPLRFNIVVELRHKLVHLVHLLHHQRVAFLFGAERDGE